MRRLLPFAVALIPLSILWFESFWDFANLRYLISYLIEGPGALHTPWFFFQLVVRELVTIFFTITSITYFASRDTKMKEACVYVLRSFFIISFLLGLPRQLVLIASTSWGWDNAYGYPGIIRTCLDIFICIVLWRAAPYGKIPHINISDYPLYDLSGRKERLLHHFGDLLFLLSFRPSALANLSSEETPLVGKIVSAIVIAVVYFLYFFLSEALFRQTPGQSLTGSCVVGTHTAMSTRKALLRALGRLIPFNSFSFLWRGNWHDRVSGTTVVHRNSWQDIPFGGER